MRLYHSKSRSRALTFTEALVVMAIIGMVVFIWLGLREPRKDRATWAPTLACVNNLKVISIALDSFAEDDNHQFPSQVSTTNGGAMEFNSKGSPAPYFLAITNYLGPTWWGKVLLCPADTAKYLSTNRTFGDSNISYFVNVDAIPGVSNIILSGDRNWQVGGRPVEPGLFILTTNLSVGWTEEIHSKIASGPCGNLLFSDAHVETIRGRLDSFILRQPLATNRIDMP